MTVVFAGDTRGAQNSSMEGLELADDDKKRENSILLHEGFPKLGAPLTVVLIYFTHRVGI
jgi:hypothetical protein